jgi:hypothetical protein
MVWGSEMSEILAKGALSATSKRFWFKVLDGATAAADSVSCGPAAVPFVQLGAEHTVAPGLAVEFNHGEISPEDHTHHH